MMAYLPAKIPALAQPWRRFARTHQRVFKRRPLRGRHIDAKMRGHRPLQPVAPIVCQIQGHRLGQRAHPTVAQVLRSRASVLAEGFSHFVTSMTAPVASGWSGCRVGLAPTGKRPSLAVQGPKSGAQTKNRTKWGYLARARI
jgi:hypothetical protein